VSGEEWEGKKGKEKFKAQRINTGRKDKWKGHIKEVTGRMVKEK
jgi:hypothetical protein